MPAARLVWVSLAEKTNGTLKLWVQFFSKIDVVAPLEVVFATRQSQLGFAAHSLRTEVTFSQELGVRTSQVLFLQHLFIATDAF